MSIKVDNLIKEFKDKKNGTLRAVDGVTFQCDEGRIFGLLGLNGAGKTTILRIICTILKPLSGDVHVSGFNVSKDTNEVRKRIGFLPADSGLYNHFTARETLIYFGRLFKYPEEKLAERVNYLIGAFGMEEFADKTCKGLSSGMKQKICLARSIVHDPPVVIFDEPTNSLDVVTRVAVHDFILQCKAQGKCVVLSTHLMSEAQKLCDDIAILNKGKIVVKTTLDEMRRETGKDDLEHVFLSYVGANGS